MSTEILTAIIGSGVLASLITAIFTKNSKDKTEKLQYITNERKKWRDDLRDATVALRNFYNDSNSQNTKLQFKSYSEAKVYFQIRLNPYDEQDEIILNAIGKLITKENTKENMEKIEKEVAKLLKYDWDRAKYEVKGSNMLLTPLFYLLFLVLMFKWELPYNYFVPSNDFFSKIITFLNNTFLFSFESMLKNGTLLYLLLITLLFLFIKLLVIYALKKITAWKLFAKFFNIPYRGIFDEKNIIHTLLEKIINRILLMNFLILIALVFCYLFFRLFCC